MACTLADSRVENSAQVLSFLMKFVHGQLGPFVSYQAKANRLKLRNSYLKMVFIKRSSLQRRVGKFTPTSLCLVGVVVSTVSYFHPSLLRVRLGANP
jgi:hypothetical protein